MDHHHVLATLPLLFILSLLVPQTKQSCTLMWIDGEAVCINLEDSHHEYLGYGSTLEIENSSIAVFRKNTLPPNSNMEELSLKNCGIKNLSEDAFGDMPYLRHLDLQGNQISSTTFLKSAPQLSFLNLSSNNLKNSFEIEVNAFDGLQGLNYLDLSSNNLETLPGNLFSNLLFLNSLKLNNNKLISIEGDHFSGLNDLHTLNIRNTSIQEIPFLELQSLSILDLSENSITSLRGRMFVGLQKLSSLSLKQSNLTDIEQKAFYGLGKLEFVDLSFNDLRYLNSSVFEGLSNLVTLDLSKSNIEVIEYEASLGLDNLKYLNLSENQIEVLNNKTFYGLNLLVELKLSKANIKVIEVGSFNYLKSLCFLDLSNNNFSEIFLHGLPDLKSVHLSGLSIENVQTNIFGDFKILNNFNLSHNSITSIDGQVFGAKKVKHLDISFNQIINFKPGIFKSLQFETFGSLNLDYNELVCLKGGLFSGIRNVFNITIENNKINRIEPGAFRDVEMMKIYAYKTRISLNYNKLTHLFENSFFGILHLGILEITYNELEEIDPNTFLGLNSLVSLHLGNNNLQYFGIGTFSHLRKLQRLNVSNNKFSKFNDVPLFPLEQLNTLNLEGNNLFDINYSSLLSQHSKLSQVTLSNNPWLCSKLLQILKAFRTKKIKYLIGSTNEFPLLNIDGIGCHDIDEGEIVNDEKFAVDNSSLEKTLSSQLSGIKNAIFKSTNAMKSFLDSWFNQINTSQSSNHDRLTSMQLNNMYSRQEENDAIFSSFLNSTISKPVALIQRNCEKGGWIFGMIAFFLVVILVLVGVQVYILHKMFKLAKKANVSRIELCHSSDE